MVVVSVSPQARASVAAKFHLSATEASHLTGHMLRDGGNG